MTRRTRLWTGLGASFLIGASAAAMAAGGATAPDRPDAPSHHHHPSAQPDAVHVSQGGEGGERGALAGLDPNAAFAAHLLLMHGHFRAGTDLFHAGDRQNAAMHFAHPLSEIYDDVAPMLDARGIAQFRDVLQEVPDATAGGADADTVARLRAKALAVIDAALATVAPDGNPPPALFAAAATAVLRAAAHEYGASIEDGRFSDVEEYQDARGFVLVVRDWLLRSQAVLEERNPAEYARLTAIMAELVAAFPTPVPPPAPVRGVAEVLGLVARAEFALTNLK